VLVSFCCADRTPATIRQFNSLTARHRASFLLFPAASHVAIMDSVTQLQNYLSSITTFMTHSLQHATHGAQTVSVEQLHEALKAEQVAYREMQAAATAKLTTPNSTTPGGSASAGDQTAAASSAGAVADSSLVIPSLDAPLYSGLYPNVEHAMADRAHQLFKRVIEADVLLASLPQELGEAAQRKQLEQLAYLEAYNERAGRELLEAQEEAALWQKRVSHVLQQAAAAQLRSSTNHEAAAEPAHQTPKEEEEKTR
jgi:hypothetical protein